MIQSRMPTFPITPQISLPPHFPNLLLLHSPTVRCTSTTTTTTAAAKDSPFPDSGSGGVRMPTAPWMRTPLLLPTDSQQKQQQQQQQQKHLQEEDGEVPTLTGRVKGGRSRQAMKRIVQSVARLTELDPPREIRGEEEVEEVLGFEVPIGKEGGDEKRGKRVVPWDVRSAGRKVVFGRAKKEKAATLAERIIAAEDLGRLRSEAREMNVWVRAKKAGVTQDVVDEMERTWEKSELVMVKFVEPLCRNMDRAVEIVEAKTGGLVVWRKNDALVVYKGQDYISSCNLEPSSSTIVPQFENIHGNNSDTLTNVPSEGNHENKSDGLVTIKNENQQRSMFIDGINSISGSLYEREANRLLDGLGPRFIDWWWSNPLPIDADLLPEDVPGYKPPLRLRHSHVRRRLRNDELTYLRHLAIPLPTHFALGKNSKLQGLAATIIKLWEKSLIAKIAIKRGIPNTNYKLICCELKRLTGGIVILSNKFFIILYRGNDFLSKGAVKSILERESQLKILQLSEEQARFNATDSRQLITDGKIGTYEEFQEIKSVYDPYEKENSDMVEMIAEKENLETELRKQEYQLSMLRLKLEKSENDLARLNAIWKPSAEASDQELLTTEERQAFRKIGLKMDDVLLLGRRGIYDGVIRAIHLHWKHRELVKVITMQGRHSHVMHTAKSLEIESGGVLVSIEELKTGHAIIIYRGKNYQTNLKILIDDLPTKREALKRSIEVQRRGSLKFFVRQREKSIRDLKRKLESVEERRITNSSL